MALAFSMPRFIFGHVHDESRDGADGGMGSGAVGGLVLVFLVVRLPPPAEFETCRLAMKRLVEEGLHLPLLLMALEGEASFGGEDARDAAERKRLGE